MIYVRKYNCITERKYNIMTTNTVTVRKTTRKNTSTIADAIGEHVINIANIGDMKTRDIKKYPIRDDEIRNAVEVYYDMQDVRVRTGNRKGAVQRDTIKKLKECGIDATPETHEVTPVYLECMEFGFKNIETLVTKFLKNYAENHPVGRWMLSITGVGPVIAAAMLAYIDIKKCKAAGSIWAYAGIDGPRKVRTAGKKITWNPKFRVVCWKLGQSFVKVSNRPNDVYGKLYREKKEWYEAKNAMGGFAEKAKKELELKNYGHDTVAYQWYSQGKLPPAHIDAMARRFAVKMFLSHLFELWYEYENGCKPPKPFIEVHKGHVHIIPPPNREILFPNDK